MQNLQQVGSSEVVDVYGGQERTGVAAWSGLTLERFRQYSEMTTLGPTWRHQADKAADYVDGNQIAPEERAIAEARGLPDITANMMAPIINVVLGMEERMRLDWRVTSDGPQNEQVAEAISTKLKEAQRETQADRARSDAYSGQIRAGVHWVEVGRNSDPFKYKYRVDAVHRREIWWDWRDTTPDLSKSTWLIRKKIYDVNDFAAYFPGKEQFIQAYARGGMAQVFLEPNSERLDLSQSVDQERQFGLGDLEFRDPYSMTVAPYEVCYRCWHRGYVLRLQNERVVELDLNNPLHKVMVSNGQAKPELAVYSKVYRSLWVGPMKLSDQPFRFNRWPYIPFFGYREDLTGVPYGLARGMIPLQDEVNARRNKLMHLLSAKTVVMDSDALDTEVNDLREMLDNINSANALVVLDPNRTNKDANAFRVDSHTDLSIQQLEVMKDAAQMMQQVVGVFNAMLGRDQSAQSGVAISGLVEQSTQGMAEINGNYRYASQNMGQALVDEITYDWRGQQVQIQVGERATKTIISLNTPVKDPRTGEITIVNDTEGSKAKVALEDVPSTPSYRQSQLRLITETMRGAAQPIQSALFPFILELTDISERDAMADAIRGALGVPGPIPESEKAAQQQQAMAEIQHKKQMQEMAQQAELAKITAEAKEADGKAREADARAALLEFELQEKRMGVVHSQAKEVRDQQTHDLASIDKLREFTQPKEGTQ